MQTLRDKLIEQILMLVQEADIKIGNGWDYEVSLDRRFIEFCLKHNLPELDILLTEYDKQKADDEATQQSFGASL